MPDKLFMKVLWKAFQCKVKLLIFVTKSTKMYLKSNQFICCLYFDYFIFLFFFQLYFAVDEEWRRFWYPNFFISFKKIFKASIKNKNTSRQKFEESSFVFAIKLLSHSNKTRLHNKDFSESTEAQKRWTKWKDFLLLQMCIK